MNTRHLRRTRSLTGAHAPFGLALLCALLTMGCTNYAGTSGNGGGGPVVIGGPPNTACNPTIHGEGCSGTDRVTCDAKTSTWQALASCPSGQLCKGVVDPADPQKFKQITSCVSSTTGGGDTTSTPSDGGTTDAGATDAATTTMDTNATTTDTGTTTTDTGTTTTDTGTTTIDTGTATTDTGTTTTDTGTTTTDTSSGPICGDQQCDPGETATTCPIDCKTGPKCGDGTCDTGETATTCPADCKTTSSCGDGKCTKGETYSSCAKDCGGATGSFSANACWDSKCPKESKACKDHYVCAGLMGCGKDGLDDNACIKKHGWTQTEIDALGDVFKDLATCGYKACADPNAAKCSDKGKDGQANRCGQYDDTWPCNCDSQCSQYNDCCSDYSATCKKP